MPYRPRAPRIGFVAALGAVTAGILVLGGHVLATGGWSVWEVLLLLCLALNAPWLALSAVTGVLGAAVRWRGWHPLAAAGDAPIQLRTAVAVCVRDEEMGAVLPPLLRLMQGLGAQGDRFALAILSDTADPARAAVEEAAIAALPPALRPFYRRRPANTGFKAGNIMDFLDGGGRDFDLLLLLDADSEMTPEFVLRLVQFMQGSPGTAILQPTIVGRPAAAPFGRLFGFGHRVGSHTWAAGQDWWQGDEGPFWGHNALLRIAPFRAHCRLPLLPDGSHILSHDHVEAARLHAAGWAVRIVPGDAGSFDAHPPDLIAFIARDRRWAAGNMQYRHLLGDRTLGVLGRFQLVQAILHYALAPTWFAMLPLAALNAATDAQGTPRAALLALLLLCYFALHMPRLLGHGLELLGHPAGGRAAYARAALAESGFLLLFDSIAALDKTFAVLSHLFGRHRRGWAVQQRVERGLTWSEAASQLWPYTLVGGGLVALFAAGGSVFALLLGSLVTSGLLLAIPFAVLTSIPDAAAREPAPAHP